MVAKEYAALVRGRPRPRRGLIDLPLRRNASGRVVVDPQGAQAKTRYETLRTWAGATLLRVRPLTGRMHQIRVHLAARGTPVLGDRFYGGSGLVLGTSRGRERNGPSLPVPPRLCLHALRLRLPASLHGSGDGLVEAPWPDDLERYARLLSEPADG
jgi:23S rRNA-/tRNA-specific pseudouridylate synthase